MLSDLNSMHCVSKRWLTECLQVSVPFHTWNECIYSAVWCVLTVAHTTPDQQGSG